ncbi:hypothetical protein Dd703_3228 [Musicola paradisiaca Ech703]|uniref:Uncharacterized protein n=1 Tax=Musicola paradisiaca (strain Ech703) TaxID=579405 RepID=C6CDC0_MUSP7|nr:hypothetical protein Dd703_3228 [Musicola paradisiaca Ech703]
MENVGWWTLNPQPKLLQWIICRHFVATGNKKGVPFSRNPLI